MAWSCLPFPTGPSHLGTLSAASTSHLSWAEWAGVLVQVATVGQLDRPYPGLRESGAEAKDLS